MVSMKFREYMDCSDVAVHKGRILIKCFSIFIVLLSCFLLLAGAGHCGSVAAEADAVVGKDRGLLNYISLIYK